MSKVVDQIKDEIGLVVYLNDHLRISYEQLVEWASGRYNQDEVCTWVVNESTCINDALGALIEKYGYVEFSTEKILASIAEDYFRDRASIMQAVGAAYNLLNTEGDGEHELSYCLYRLIDDSCETEGESEAEARKTFLPGLKKYVGRYSELYDRVIKSTQQGLAERSSYLAQQ
jgi:hypothetical protein